jgi:hypothetical protein
MCQTKILQEKTHQLLRFEILTLEETLLKSDREILGIKDIREVWINRLDLPLQENYVDEGEEVIEELEDTHINLMGIHDNEAIFLTQEEQEIFLLNQTKVSEEPEDA